MKQTLRYLMSAGLAVNGAAMLLAPARWFYTVPGVAETGPLNLHLVRDVGCAYLVVALGLVWRARKGAAGAPAAYLGALFLLLHAGVHLWELAVGLCGWNRFLHDVPGVVLPALLVGWLSGSREGEVNHV